MKELQTGQAASIKTCLKHDNGPSNGNNDAYSRTNALLGSTATYTGSKTVFSNMLNRQNGLPRSSSVITIARRSDNIPLCAMEGTDISNARTAANAVLFIERVFASRRGMTVHIYGTGPVSDWIIEMLPLLPEGAVEIVKVKSGGGKSCAAFVKRHKGKGSFMLERMVEVPEFEADVVIEVTDSMEPMVGRKHVKSDGAVLNLGHDGVKTEVIQGVIEKGGNIIVDDLENCFARMVQSFPLYCKKKVQERGVQGEGAQMDVAKAMAGKLGVRNFYDVTEADVKGFEGVVLATFVGLACFDVAVAGRMFEMISREKAGGSGRGEGSGRKSGGCWNVLWCSREVKEK